MKMFKGKFFRASICLFVGAALLGVAVFANYDNANGYKKYKDAIKKTLYETNFTAKIDITAKLDNEELLGEELEFMCDFGGEIPIYTKSTERNWQDRGGETLTNERYKTKGFEYNRISALRNGESNENINIYNSYDDEPAISWIGVEEDDKKIFDRVINFAELLADAFVGDIKNNFVLTESSDDSERYNLTLSEEQIPEIAKAGTSLMVSVLESSQEEDSENIEDETVRILNEMLKNDKEIYIDNVSCDFETDKDGNLSENTIIITAAGYDKGGNRHDLAFEVAAKLDGHGTTVIKEPEFLNNLPSITLKDGSVIEVRDIEKLNADVTGTLAPNISLYYYANGERDIFINNGVETNTPPAESEAEAVDLEIETEE